MSRRILTPKTTIIELLRNIMGLGRKIKLACKWIKVLNGTWHTRHCGRAKFCRYLNHMNMIFWGASQNVLTCVKMPKKFLNMIFHNTS